MEIPNGYKRNVYWLVLIFLAVVSLFFVVKIVTEFRSYDDKAEKTDRTIVLSGHGEVTAVPDIANLSFTISKDAKNAKDAQTQVSDVEKKSLDLLKQYNIADKDIKTQNASFYPKYEYRVKSTIPCTSSYCPPAGNNVIVGYTASESITVKVRNTDDVGKIMQGLGTLGVSDLSGPNFTVDNEDSLKAQARKAAIDDAKAKAVELAKELGVRLGKVVSFNESNSYPVPMYSAKSVNESLRTGDAAQLPKGENTINSDVTITYQIR